MGRPKKEAQKASGVDRKPIVTTIRIDRSIWMKLKTDAMGRGLKISEYLEALIEKAVP